MIPIRELVTAVLAVASVVAEVPKLVRARTSRRPPPVYHDEHSWSVYELGERVPEHCVYCKQARQVATRWCPGVAR